MGRSVYVATVEGFTGKSAVALGLLDAALATRRAGRPSSGRSSARDPEAERDYVLDLLVSHEAVQLSYDECAGVTYDDVHADPDAAMDRIVDRYHPVAEKCDAVVVVGSDYTDVGAPTEFAFNARVAANLGSPVLLVLNGNDRDLDAAAHGRRPAPPPSSRAHHGSLFAIIANRVTAGPELCAPTRCRATACRRTPSPSSRCSARPSVAALMAACDGTLAQRRRDAAAARGARPRGRGDDAAQRARPPLRGSARRHAGRPARDRARRADRARLGELPADVGDRAQRRAPAARRRCSASSTGSGSRCRSSPPPSTPTPPSTRPDQPARPADKDSPRKIATALALFAEHVDGDALLDRLEVAQTQAVTPLMFEHQLIDTAVADRRHIVLPEGEEERILRAADILLRRGVADLTLLGDPLLIQQRAATLGVDISAAAVLSPFDEELRERFAGSTPSAARTRASTSTRRATSSSTSPTSAR